MKKLVPRISGAGALGFLLVGDPVGPVDASAGKKHCLKATGYGEKKPAR